ncbi:hypothetical protein [Methanocalculus taiwanensis]|nr:hypothetical protein [Methanocalculus taiwanensis]
MPVTSQQAGVVPLLKWERQGVLHIDTLYLMGARYNSISPGALISPQ